MVDLSAGATVALGVLVGLVSTSVQSIGLALQRKSHLLEDEREDDHLRRPPYKRRRWQIGMAMFLISNIVGSTIQITTLPLPVLSTLQASGLVFNTICAAVILDEPFTRYSLVGTALVATGALLIGIYGSVTEPSHNLDQLLQLLWRKQFVLWLMGTAIMVLAVQILAWLAKRLSPRPTPRSRLIRGMCFGFISGLLSAHTLLVAKSAVELLIRTIVDRHNQFNRWQSWMILIGLVVLALSQLWYLHQGLKLCSTSVVYPFVFCVYNIIAIIDGLIYFRQTSRLAPLHAGLIAVGTVILLSGVLSLSWRLEQHHDGFKISKRMSEAHLATPITALTPGIGVLNATISAEEGAAAEREAGEQLEEEAPFLRTETFEQDFDPERGFGPVKMRTSAVDSRRGKRKSRADETTPLIRAPTTPSPRGRKSPKRLAPRRRRMTVTEEAGEIWDELNDRDEFRKSSSSLNLHSPRSLYRSRTLPAARPQESTSRSAPWRRRSWWEGMANPKNWIQTEGAPTEGTETAVSDTDGTDDIPMSPGRESSGAWFKLKWWRKRLKGGDGRDEGGP